MVEAGALPAEVLLATKPDPVYGRPDREDDWHIEPLMTEAEVASVLRISNRAVRSLGIAATLIAGERRYKQSEVRRYILEHQEKSFRR